MLLQSSVFVLKLVNQKLVLLFLFLKLGEQLFLIIFQLIHICFDLTAHHSKLQSCLFDLVEQSELLSVLFVNFNPTLRTPCLVTCVKYDCVDTSKAVRVLRRTDHHGKLFFFVIDFSAYGAFEVYFVADHTCWIRQHDVNK